MNTSRANIEARYNGLKKWDVLLTSRDGVRQIITHIKPDRDNFITLTVRPWRPSKYRFVNSIKFVWLKLMVWLNIY